MKAQTELDEAVKAGKDLAKAAQELKEDRVVIDREIKANREANEARAQQATPNGDAELFEAWVQSDHSRDALSWGELRRMYEKEKEEEREDSRAARKARQEELAKEKAAQEEQARAAEDREAQRAQPPSKRARRKARGADGARSDTSMSEPESVASSPDGDTQRLMGALASGKATPAGTGGFTTPVGVPPHPLH